MKYGARWLLTLTLSPGVMFLWLYLGAVHIQKQILIPRFESSLVMQFSTNKNGISLLEIENSNRSLLWGKSLKLKKVVLFNDSLFFASEPCDFRPFSFQEVVFAPSTQLKPPISQRNFPIRFFPVHSPNESINFNPNNRVNRIPLNSREDSLLSAAWRNVIVWNDEKKFFKSQLRLIKRKG